MKKFVRYPGERKPVEFHQENSMVESKSESSQNKKQYTILAWLASAIFIFSLLYGSSLLALVWLPPYAGLDMKSNLVADYSPWITLEFQPIEPAILEEIKKERGLPEKIAIDGMSWSTPVVTFPSTAVSKEKVEATLQPTIEDTLSAPTVVQASSTGNSIPTSTVSVPQPTATPHPTQVANPTKSHKPAKTPKNPKHPKTPKP